MGLYKDNGNIGFRVYRVQGSGGSVRKPLRRMMPIIFVVHIPRAYDSAGSR